MHSIGFIFDVTPCRMTGEVGNREKKDGCDKDDLEEGFKTATLHILHPDHLFVPVYV